MAYDRFSNTHLICPYCGYEEEVDFETFFSTEADCSEEHECPECGETYIANRSVIFCYETEKLETK